MKEFTFSVLSNLGSSVSNGLAHYLPLLLTAYSSVVCCRQKNCLSPSILNPKRFDSSSSRYRSQLNVVRVAFFLREPVQATTRILRRNKAFLDHIETLRNSPQSPAVAAKIAKDIQIPQHCEISELLALDKRSRIVACFHFGNFVYGLHKLLCLQPDTSNTAVLSQNKSTSDYIDNMTSAFGKKGVRLENQMLLDKVDVRGLSGFLRNPNRCLVMFADLPSGFGKTVEVEFLGRKAAFSKSIALLSLTNNIPVLPVICYEDGETHQVEIGRQIEPLTREGETRADAVTRITQIQLDFFQHFFVRHKEQWRYLNHLSKYFTEGSA